MLPLARSFPPSIVHALVHAGPEDEAAALKMGIAFTSLKCNYLRAIYIFVINLGHYFCGEQTPNPHPPPRALPLPTAADYLIYSRHDIEPPFSHLHRGRRLGRFCASAVSQQFNLLSPLGGDIFFYHFVWRCKTNRLA